MARQYRRAYQGGTVVWTEDHADLARPYPYTFMLNYPEGRFAERRFTGLIKEVTAWCQDQLGPESDGVGGGEWWRSGGCFRIRDGAAATAFKIRWL